MILIGLGIVLVQARGDDWSDPTKKTTAIMQVLDFLHKNQDKRYDYVCKGSDEACVNGDKKTHDLFKHFGLEVPAGKRAIVFDRGEIARDAGRSVIIAVPPSDITPCDINSANCQAILLQYVLNYVHWANQPNNVDWYDGSKKMHAILRVLDYMVRHHQEALACIDHDEKASNLFEDPKIGNIHIPRDQAARVVVLRTDEKGAGWKGSVWLEFPSPLIAYWMNNPNPEPGSGGEAPP
jgi:hypothetical protein